MGEVLTSLGAQLKGMVAVTAVATLLCSLAGFLMTGNSGAWLPLAAAMSSLPVGAIVVVYFNRYGLSAETIVVGMMMRVFLTTLLAGLCVLLVAELRQIVFFLSLGLIYLANLGLETWFALQQSSSPLKKGTQGKAVE